MPRERFGIYADATCPTGRTPISQRNDGIKVCRTSREDTAPVVATCPAGNTVYTIVTEGRETYTVCVPSMTAVYAPTFTGGPADWPCRPGDYFGTSAETWSDFKCIPSSAASAASSSAAASSSSAASSAASAGGASGDTTLDGLTTQYTSLKAQYSTLATQALNSPAQMTTLLPQLQLLNQQIASLLDQMLQAMQFAKQGPNSDRYRDQLVETLSRIQTDYNGLKTNTDTLETLRRIRGAQDESWKGTLFIYLMAFIAAAVLLTLVILFRGQKKVSAAAPSMSPPAMPALT